MAKRSPILGYNHNVRYRGLVFHVQTEDSGVLAPHLFTHLFHSGVIVSTRKYVYDSGSTEEAIKSLMQAQHKAVMKDLRRGHFDDKIDQYLGGTPGLLPRGGADAGSADAEAGAEPSLARASQTLAVVEGIESGPVATPPGDAVAIGREATIEEPSLALRPTEEAVQAPSAPRTTTAERTSAPSQVRTTLPAAPPTHADDGATIRMESGDSQEITIQLEADEPDAVPVLRRRPLEAEAGPWDTAPVSDGVPGMLPGPPTIRNPGDATGPVMAGATGPITGPLSQRAAKAVGAASLPPARPIARPASRPAMVPPQVVSRPLPADERRPATQSDAVEVYAPAPPSAELPPQQPPERPGQYSQHKKISSRIPNDADPREGRPIHPAQGAIPQIARVGSSPAIPQPVRQVSTAQITQPRTSPAGVPVARAGTPPPMPAQRVTPVSIPVPSRTASPPPAPTPTIPQHPAPPPPPARGGVPAPVEKQQSRPVAGMTPLARQTPPPMPAVRPPVEAPRTRTPTPQRVSVAQQGAAPGAPGLSPGRTGTPNRDSSVVMSRPAVIVGAPGKPAGTSHRVRKAREDEGRGFGQGLISEKSLDEVILAYLSEDGEEK